MQFHDHFSSIAQQYATSRPRYPVALFEWLTQLTPRHDLAWDCACGNGQAAISLAEHYDHVVATDASAAQIAAASPHQKISYRVALAESSGLAEHSVDLITVGQALHWFNLGAFFNEAKRVLKPGAVLATWGYGWLTTDTPNIRSVIDQFQKNLLGPYWPDETALVDAHYQTITFPFEEIVAPTFPLGISWSLDELIGHFRSWSSTTRFIKTNGYDPTTSVRYELTHVWGNPQQKQSFSWPLFMRVGKVTS